MSVNNAGSCLMKRALFPSAIAMKWIMFPFVYVLLALLMLITLFLEIQLISLSLLPSPIEHHRKMISTIPTASASSERVPLYIITAAGRPELLTRGIFHVLPFFKCGFDVHWIIVHNFPDERLRKAPLFRNVFPWITELFAHNAASDYGDHERNVGIEHVLSLETSGLVYFLDDDNALPVDICREDVRKTLRVDHMYYADQLKCKGIHPFLSSTTRMSSQWKTRGFNNFTLEHRTDTANWFTPAWLFRQEYYGGGTQGPDGVRWKLQKKPGSDGIFFTSMVRALLQTDGTEDRLVQLPTYPHVRVHHNYLKDCEKQIIPKGDRHYRNLYRSLVQDMQKQRELPSFLNSSEKKMNSSKVAFHDHVHILYTLRSHLQDKRTATYVEIGVWVGATSIFMSRHPLLTNVIGIDGFVFDHQLEEAEAHARHLKGKEPISWIKSDSKLAVPQLQEQLNGTSIDILLINGNHSMESVMTDFELYAPLVSEGGFIVFDDFMATRYSAGVREAVLHLIQNGQINVNDYDVIGCLRNTVEAGPLGVVDDEDVYDWQSKVSNEFILCKKGKRKQTSEDIVRNVKGNGTISWINSDSQLGVPESLNGSSIDILFIAGDQSMEGVRTTFGLYAPLVSKGGFIVFDDSSMDVGYSAGVREAMKDLIQKWKIHPKYYRVISCLPNHGAGSMWVNNKYFYDWEGQVSNWLVLYKRTDT